MLQRHGFLVSCLSYRGSLFNEVLKKHILMWLESKSSSFVSSVLETLGHEHVFGQISIRVLCFFFFLQNSVDGAIINYVPWLWSSAWIVWAFFSPTICIIRLIRLGLHFFLHLRLWRLITAPWTLYLYFKYCSELKEDQQTVFFLVKIVGYVKNVILL